MLAIDIDSHHLGLRVAVWQQGGKRCEVLSTGQLEDHQMKLAAIGLVRHVLASSIYRSREPLYEILCIIDSIAAALGNSLVAPHGPPPTRRSGSTPHRVGVVLC